MKRMNKFSQEFIKHHFKIDSANIFHTTKTGAGFSLIEILVGISIIITATTVVLAIIVSSFRISGKNTSNEIVRQNGNYALSQISRTVQFAESFVGVTVNDSSFSIANTVTVCQDPDPDSNPATPPPALTRYKYLRIISNSVSKTYSCVSNELRVDGSSMVNQNKILVPDSTCYFTCSQDNPGAAPVIGVNYNLVLGQAGDANEKAAKLNFSTKIKMRNQ